MLNLYTYAGDNPLIYTDPLGTCDEKCLEELNAKRQALARAALSTGNPVATYLAARETARALEATLGRELAHIAVLAMMQADTDSDDAIQEVLLAIPTREQVRSQYIRGVNLLVEGLTVLAALAVLTSRGKVDPLVAQNTFNFGIALVIAGSRLIHEATEADEKYYNGQVFETLSPWFRFWVRLVFGGP